MKSFLRNLTLIALGLGLLPSGAQAAPPAQGDLVLGFQAQGGTGSNINVLVNLGPATALRDTPNGGTLANIDAALDAAYGSDWFTRTDLYFGVFGNFSNQPVSGPGAGTAVNGDPSSTVYVSRPAATAGASLPWTGLTASQLTTAATTHKGQITMMQTLTFAGNVDQVSSSDPVKFANGWTAYNPFVAAGVQGGAYSVFGGGIQNFFGQGGSIVFVDIQRILGTNTGAVPPAAVAVGTGDLIATLAITSTGDVVAASDFHELTLTNTPGGTVSGAVTGQVFADGAALSLTATPATGFTFTGWTGAFAPGTASDNPLNVTMTADRVLNAVFAKDLSDPDNDGISTHDELVIHNTDPNVANTVPGIPAGLQFDGNIGQSGGLVGAEIAAFDPGSERLFVTCNAGLQIIDLSDPSAPVLVTTINLSAAPYNAVSNDVTSVAVHGGVVAATTVNANKEANGSVVFMNAANAEAAQGHLSTVTVGRHPDMVTFTPNGSKALVANEGEYLNSDGGPGDTPGSVSIIDVVTNGFANPIVNNVGFGAFDGMETTLRNAGVRIFAGQSASNDLEPEYIAVSPDGATAYVTLQEANAIGILDIAAAAFTDIVPLGQKDFSNLLADFNDQDGVSALTTGNPVFGLYMPDAIAAYQQGGNTYYVMANEGDDRDDFVAPNETIRVNAGGYVLDPTIFPDAADLKTSARIGRLTVTNAPGLNGDTDNDTDIDEIRMLGARSFTIRDEAGAIVYDSGDLIERTIASYGKGAPGEPIFDDSRSDNKGPEPEGIAVATINGTIYAFVGLERSNGVMVFDITDTNNVSVTAFLRNPGDLSPEGVLVVPAIQSPTNRALVIVTNEGNGVSGHGVSIFSFDQDVTTDTDGNGFTDFEEQQIDALPKQFTVGDTISNVNPIDLSFIGLDPGQTLAVVGLPRGLVFNAVTKQITGTITAELAGEVFIQIKAGKRVVASIPFGMAVIPYAYLGTYEALLETTGMNVVPAGKFSITVTSPGVYTATLELVGQTRRSAKGTFANPVVGSTQSVAVPFLAFKAFPATTVNVDLSSASDLVDGTEGIRTLRGFRLAKPGRVPLQRVTVALTPTVPGDRTTTPGGTGYASGALNAKGQLPLVTVLGDGQAASIALLLSQTNQAVVWSQPYKEKLNSFVGGIITIGDLGQPGRGGSSDLETDGLLWRKAAVATEPAYPAGFGLATPLALEPAVSRWVPMSSLEGLSLSLGLNFREINVGYNAPPASVLPSKLSLRGKFALVRVAPANSVAWSGKTVGTTGLFSGTLALPAPAAKTTVGGVLLQDASFGTQVGVGVIKIPVTGPGLVKGAYQTSGIELEQ